MNDDPETTIEGVRKRLEAVFPEAQILDLSPPKPPIEDAKWLGVRFEHGDTSYVGVTEGALNHPQDLVEQLEDLLGDIGPGMHAMIILRDLT